MPDAPSAAAVPPVTPAQRRVLLLLADLSPAPLSLLAATLGGHPNATRQHLEALARLALVTVAPSPPAGQGRPPHVYAITPAGRRALDGPDTDHRQLALMVLGYLSESGRLDQAAAIGRYWGRTLAQGCSGGPQEVLWQVLERLGYEPRGEDPVELWGCPLAHTDPDLRALCSLHQGLLDGALEKVGGRARLRPLVRPGCCLVELSCGDGRGAQANPSPGGQAQR